MRMENERAYPSALLAFGFGTYSNLFSRCSFTSHMTVVCQVERNYKTYLRLDRNIFRNLYEPGMRMKMYSKRVFYELDKIKEDCKNKVL